MSSLIRPIDMSGVVQRSQEVSQIKQQENNKAFVDGQNFGQHFSQEVKHQMNSVTDSEKGERKKEQYDAKKGNGREYEDGQQKKRNKKQNTDKTTLKSQSNFDIRI